MLLYLKTNYWLKLMYETKRIDTATYKHTERLCGNVRRLLIASRKNKMTIKNGVVL